MCKTWVIEYLEINVTRNLPNFNAGSSKLQQMINQTRCQSTPAGTKLCAWLPSLRVLFSFYFPQKKKQRPLWKYLPANLKSKLKSVEAKSMTAVSVTGGSTCWDWNYAASSQAVSRGDLKRQCLGGGRCLAAVTQTYITRLPGLYVKVLW